MMAHIIFDVKLDSGITHKSIFVTDVHNFDSPTSVTYESVVSRDSVQIALVLSVLNEHYLKFEDVQNAYLNVKSKERVWF